jgi:hypothetical protein
MSSKTDGPGGPAPARGLWAGLALVLAVAVLARAPNLGEWSLWEDEETSLHFSQRPDKPFPASFPIFFYLLRVAFELTGVGVLPGRALCAALGVLSVALTYLGFARLWPRPVALLAALFVALSVGHLFWSQSVRYYILLFVFQLLALCLFLDGFERDRPWQLVLANVAVALGLWTHFSGALLLPIFVGYLALMLLRREAGAGYNLRGYLAFGVPFAALCAVFGWQFVRFRTSLGGLVTGATNPLWITAQAVFYFGPATVALALVAPFVVPGAWRDRKTVFLAVVAAVPLLELAVISLLNLTIVAWYYAFFALLGFAGLAAQALVALAERGRRRLAAALAGLALVTLAGPVLAYHLAFYGDRPRWKEAAAVLRDEARFDPAATANPPVFANVPGVVAYYLGVPPGETMGHPAVRPLPAKLPAAGPGAEQWYLVEGSSVPPATAAWLEGHCEKVARFEARSGPKDRTVTLYRFPPRGGKAP